MSVSRQTAPRHPGWIQLCRALFVLLVLLNFAALQIDSAIEFHAHQHGGPNDHCCPGCHGGHFPLLQAVGVLQLTGLSVSAWYTTLHEVVSHSVDAFALSSPRAPPV
jgi:hypothetical protein